MRPFLIKRPFQIVEKCANYPDTPETTSQVPFLSLILCCHGLLLHGLSTIPKPLTRLGSGSIILLNLFPSLSLSLPLILTPFSIFSLFESAWEISSQVLRVGSLYVYIFNFILYIVQLFVCVYSVSHCFLIILFWGIHTEIYPSICKLHDLEISLSGIPLTANSSSQGPVCITGPSPSFNS